MTDSSELDRLVFHVVDQARWPDFERLFKGRDGPKACWCIVWRATPQEAKRTDGASRKAAMAKRIATGVPSGCLDILIKNLSPGVRLLHDLPIVGSLMMAPLTRESGLLLVSLLFVGFWAMGLPNVSSKPLSSMLVHTELR